MSPAGARQDPAAAETRASSVELERGRRSYATRAWLDAYESFGRADEVAPLGAGDLELLATSAYMLGRDDEWMQGLERAHHLYVEAGDARPAASCAGWIGTNLALRGEIGGATGWWARAQRLLEKHGRDCPERGYMLLPTMFQQEAAGDLPAAAATAAAAAEIGQRFGDSDLFALAVQGQGYLLIKDGRISEGLRLLDEAMVAVTTGELSPIPTGLVYCGVILACQEAYELGRAREWTAALTRWCADQPDLVAFTGRCLVHRAEIMQLDGAWADALEEARRAGRRFVETGTPPRAWLTIARERCCACKVSSKQRKRRTGRQADSVGSRSRVWPSCGWRRAEQTLRLRRSSERPARSPSRSSVRACWPLASRSCSPSTSPSARARRPLSSRKSQPVTRARCWPRWWRRPRARSTSPKAVHDPRSSRSEAPCELWQDLEAPYEAARARMLVGLACRALGDDDTAAMELDAARGVFAELGAAPDLARLEALAPDGPSFDTHGLTPRELEVLRLVATGATNKAIAAELVVSERTVDRHVSNIFTKLGVSSRAAATAYAYENKLV